MKKIKQKHIERFIELAKELNQLMIEITEYNPEAEIYVEDSWNFNLMKGPTHDENDRNLRPMHENVVAHETVFRSSGGGW